MVTQNSGPVKPPVLDLSARKPEGTDPGTLKNTSPKNDVPKASTDKPGSPPTPGTQKPGTPKPEPTKAPVEDDGSGGAILFAASIGAIIGGILGAVLAFGTAQLGLWPQPIQLSNDLNRSISVLERRLSLLENIEPAQIDDLLALEKRLSTADADIAAKVADESAQRAQQNDALSELQRAPATQVQTLAEPVDLNPIEEQITTLTTRLNAIAAGVTQDDAEALAHDVSALQTQIDNATSQRNELSARLEELSTELAEATAEPEPVEPTPVKATQIPTALLDLEMAINSGKPYLAALTDLQTAQPDIHIPEVILANAQNGLANPETVSITFSAAIPAILSSRPLDPNKSWQDSLIDRLKNLVALRPTENVTGDSPDAQIARLEAAIENGDFVTAAQLLREIPPAMRTSASPFTTTINNLGTAQSFIISTRDALTNLTTNDQSGDAQ